MEDLKNFIKTLNVLYVEDEDSAREITAKMLKRFFNNVEACENGLEGYLSFQKKHANQEIYDLIISDINMPKLDGIDMTQKIREIDNEVPIIFITARHESETLIKAIQLQVLNYIIKPIDVEAMSKVIYSSCEKIFLKNTLIKKQKELEIYLNTIEKIAFVLKLDMEQNITYINDFFLKNINYTNEEIINQKLDFFNSTLVSPNLFEDINKTISAHKTWEGTIKIKPKNEDEVLYIKFMIVPIINTNISEFICIGYSNNELENEKNEIVKKMIQNIAIIKKEVHTNPAEKRNYEEEILALRQKIGFLESSVNDLTKSKSSLLNQLNAYETSALNSTDSKLNAIKKKNEENESLRKIVLILKSEKTQYQDKIKDLESFLIHKDQIIETLQNNESTLRLKIRNLELDLKKLEEEHKEKKGLFKL